MGLSGYNHVRCSRAETESLGGVIMTDLERRAWEWGLAVAYSLFLVLGDFSGWLTGKPKVSVQDVIGLSTFFVLLGIRRPAVRPP